MQRLSSSMARSNSQEAYKIAVETHTTRAASGSPLLFVWDMVTTDASFEALKFVLDAARPPLKDSVDFAKTNGLRNDFFKYCVGRRLRSPLSLR